MKNNLIDWAATIKTCSLHTKIIGITASILLIFGVTTYSLASADTPPPHGTANSFVDNSSPSPTQPSVNAVSTPAVPTESAASPDTTTATPAPVQKPAAPAAAPQIKKSHPAPNPAPTSTSKPACPECGGEPAKTPTHVGALILSGNVITITAGGISDATLNMRSDSGEAITLPYTAMSENFHLPMISASTRPIGQAAETYRSVQTFSFNASPGTVLGTYTYKIFASGINGGRYSGHVTVTIVAHP